MVKKIFYFFLGAVLFLVIVEASLCLAGHIFYKTWMMEESRVAGNGKQDFAGIDQIGGDDGRCIRVLCLGDSWTFGTGAEPGYSYPAQLQILLDKENLHKYRVYNLGIPGCYSGKLLKYLPMFLKKYEPNIVVILMGTNDVNNYPLNDLVYVSPWQRRFYFSLVSAIADLRVYKLIRLGLDGLMQKTMVFKKYAVPIDEKKRTESNQWVGTGHDLYTAGKFELGEAYLKKAINIDPSNEEPYLRLGHLYQAIREYAKSLTCYQKLIDINPYTPFRIDLYNFLFLMYQETHSRRDISDKIFYLVKKIPSDSMFKNPGMPFILSNKLTMRNLENNLIKIIDLIQSGRAIPILQTYYGFSPLNDFITSFSKKHNILLVDNAKILAGLSDSRSYFAPDVHPNNKGYLLMAESIFRLLMKINR